MDTKRAVYRGGQQNVTQEDTKGVQLNEVRPEDSEQLTVLIILNNKRVLLSDTRISLKSYVNNNNVCIDIEACNKCFISFFSINRINK